MLFELACLPNKLIRMYVVYHLPAIFKEISYIRSGVESACWRCFGDVGVGEKLLNRSKMKFFKI